MTDVQNNVPLPNDPQIEDNVPIPTQKNWQKRNLPLAEMKVGQSILIPKDAVYAARMAARRHSQAHGTEWTTKMTDGGVRVWRVK
jgi:hypothetical protein